MTHFFLNQIDCDTGTVLLLKEGNSIACPYQFDLHTAAVRSVELAKLLKDHFDVDNAKNIMIRIHEGSFLPIGIEVSDSALAKKIGALIQTPVASERNSLTSKFNVDFVNYTGGSETPLGNMLENIGELMQREKNAKPIQITADASGFGVKLGPRFGSYIELADALKAAEDKKSQL